jgi:hypothetical protein
VTTGCNGQRSVLLIGNSQRVLDDSVAGLRDLSYERRGDQPLRRRD